jgi:ferredoxin
MRHLFPPRAAKQALAPILFFPRRCLRRRWGDFDCRRCLEVCPSGALKLTAGQISYDDPACTACLRCSSVCPVEALAPALDLRDLLAWMVAAGEFSISCQRQPRHRTDAVVLPCLGLFSEEVLVVLLRHKVSVTVNLNPCRACPNQASATAFIGSLKRVQELCHPLLPGEVHLLPVEQGEKVAEPGGRRRFLTEVVAGAINGMAGLSRPKPAGGEPDQDGRRRSTLRRELLRQIAIDLDESGRKILKSAFEPQLQLNDSCRLCPRCAGICPSGALRLSRAERKKRLLFDPQRCSSCGLCVAFCQEGALFLVPPPLGYNVPLADPPQE